MTDRPLLRQIATTIAAELIRKLKAGEIPKAGIDEVRAAVWDVARSKRLRNADRQQLNDLAVRALIEAVG